MTELEKYIYSYGKYIGCGVARRAYLLHGQVYKIPQGSYGMRQAVREKELYESLPNKFKPLFPSPQFLSQGVIICSRVKLIDEMISCWTDTPLEEIEEYSLASQSSIKLFKELLSFFNKHNLDTEDLLYNGGNLGVIRNEIKIIDWGAS